MTTTGKGAPAGALETGGFLPLRLAHRLEGKPAGLAVHRGPAAVLFSDISGFTHLAEQLIAHGGPEGVERLTGVLDQRFGRWIDLVAERGGEVVKFAGDALLAVWWGDDFGGLELATDAAMDCALAIRQTLADHSQVEGVPLSLRVAVGAGQVDAVRVGGVHDRWELVAGGPAMEQLAPTLKAAEPGSVVGSEQAWVQCGEAFEGRAAPGAVAGRRAGSPSPKAAVSSRPELPHFNQYLPGVVRTHLRSDLGAFLAEHRQVTVIFIQLVDVVVGRDGWAQRLHSAVRIAQAELYDHGGSLDKVSIDDKGIAIVAAFGLPSAALAYQPVKALTSVLRLHAALTRRDLKNAIGVSSGRVFCGPIGSARRCEYTMIGDVVNRAARLMSSSEGTVVVDQATRQLARDAAEFQALPPLMLKGLSLPVERYRPLVGGAPSLKRSQGLPLIGRQSELDQLLSWLSGAAQAEACSVLLEGQPGVGRTRLVAALESALAERGIRLLVAKAQPAHRDLPFAAWQELLPAALELPVGQYRVDALSALLLDDPLRGAQLPLLNDILGLSLPETESTASLHGAPRGEATRALVTTLLQAQAPRRPFVLCLEDGRWLDSASASLLEEIVRAQLPLALLVTTRSAPDHDDPLRGLRSLEAVHHLQLTDLDAASVEKLTAVALDADVVPPDLARWIWQRTQGNPFLCRETLAALRDVLLVRGGRIEVDGGVESLDTLGIPATVEGLVVGRLDRLGPLEQIVLKTAAVLGAEFGEELLRHALPQEAQNQDLRSALDAVADVGLLERTPGDEGELWSVPQDLVRRVAYQSLVSARTRAIHRAAAEWLEQVHQGSLHHVSAMLAHHWGQARDLPRALHHLEQAGAHALKVGGAEEAARLYLRARELSERFPDQVEAVTTPLQRTGWLRQLARARADQGRFAEADSLACQAMAALGRPVPSTDAGWGRLLMGQFLRQSLNRALPSLFARRRDVVDPTDAEAAELGRLLLEIVYWEYDSPVVFPAVSLWTLNLQQRSGAAPRRSDLANTGLVLGGFGLSRTAELYFEQARSLEGSDFLDTYFASTSEALHHAMGTRWSAADLALARMREAAADVGNDAYVARADQTRGLCLLYQGRIREAESLHDQGLLLSMRQGDARGEFNARAHIALLLLETGRVDEADEQITRARTLFVGDDTPQDVRAWSATFAAVVASRRGDDQAALEAAERLIEVVGPQPKFELTYVLQFFRVGSALLDLWTQERGDTVRVRAAAETLVGKLMAKQAKAFALARPGLFLLRGRLARLQGSGGKSEGLLRKGLTLATDGSMYLEQALLLQQLATLPGTALDEQDEMSQRAQVILEDNGLAASTGASPANGSARGPAGGGPVEG